MRIENYDVTFIVYSLKKPKTLKLKLAYYDLLKHSLTINEQGRVDSGLF